MRILVATMLIGTFYGLLCPPEANAQKGSGQLLCGMSDGAGNVIKTITPVPIVNGNPHICRTMAETMQTIYGMGTQFVALCWQGSGNTWKGTVNDDDPNHLPPACQS